MLFPIKETLAKNNSLRPSYLRNRPDFPRKKTDNSNGIVGFLLYKGVISLCEC